MSVAARNRVSPVVRSPWPWPAAIGITLALFMTGSAVARADEPPPAYTEPSAVQAPAPPVPAAAAVVAPAPATVAQTYVRVAPAATRPLPPIVLEAGGGWQGPLGPFAFSMLYDRGGRFSAGGGIGGPRPSNSLPVFGAFGRARLLRSGPFSIGVAATLSRGHYTTARSYHPPPVGLYARQDVTWTWEPGYRATGALTAALEGPRWSLRLEGGLAMLLNSPRCTYTDGVAYYDGDCNAAAIPSAYHFPIEPGRVIPSVTMSVGYRFGRALPDDRSFRSPGIALALSSAATAVPLVIGWQLWTSRTNEGWGFGVMTAGISLGPAVGHLYTGDYAHAFLWTTFRTGATLLGTYQILASTIHSSDCQGSQCDDSKGGIAAGGALLLGSVASALYDIYDAPRAAERANARNSPANVALVPMVDAHGPPVSRGAALVGRF